MQHRLRATRVLALVGALGLSASFVSFIPQLARAADAVTTTPAAFVANTSQQVYVAQAVPCTATSGGETTGANCEQLYVAQRTQSADDPNAAIVVQFNPVNGTADDPYNGIYNAIGYRLADNYIYGMDSNNNLVRVGQNAQVQVLGPVPGLPTPTGNGGNYNAGTFGAVNSEDLSIPADDTTHKADTSNIYYLRTGASNNNQLYAVDFNGCAAATGDQLTAWTTGQVTNGVNPTACLSTTAYTLAQPMPNTADLVWMSGELWAMSGKASGTTPLTTTPQSSGVWRVDVLGNPNCPTNSDTCTGMNITGTPATYYAMPSATNWTENANGSSGSFPAGSPAGTLPNGVVTNTQQGYGAQWVYGNGNIGISNNQEGWVFQVRVNNPTSTTVDPTFAMVTAMDGPASNGNDGTIFPGEPVDLSLTKTTPAAFTPGNPITYTLTVTNTSQPDGADSSGYTVTDDITQLLADLGQTSSAVHLPGNCQLLDGTDDPNIIGVQVNCTGDSLPAGQSDTITFTIDSPSDISQITPAGKVISNTATVIGNERDPNADNNTSTTSSVPGELTISKTADKTSVSKAGDQITYTFSVTNTGAVAMNNVAVVDTDLPGLDMSGCANLGTISPGDPAKTCQAIYTVKATDISAAAADATKQIKNTARATGVPQGVTETYTSDPDGANVDIAHLTLSKTITSVDTTQPSPLAHTVYEAGDTIHYTFSVTNDGTVAMSNVAVSDTSLGTGTTGVQLSGCSWATLAAGATQTCTGTYVAQQSDFNTGAATIHNSATVSGTPPGATTPFTSDPATADANVAGVPELTIHKTATSVTDKVTGNTTQIIGNLTGSVHQAGDVIQYLFSVENTGSVTMTNVAVSDTSLGGGVTLTGCSWVSLQPSDPPVTCTGTYTVKQADIDAAKASPTAQIVNTARATGTPDSTDTPYTSNPDTANVDVSHLSIAKQADKATVSKAGDVVTYTITVTNDGTVAMNSVAVADTMTGIQLQSACTNMGTIAAGASKTCQATYTATAADIAAGAAFVNHATATGTPNGSGTTFTTPPASATVGVAHLTLTKTSSTTSVSSAGAVITYQFSVKNDGDVTMTNVSVSDTSLGTGTTGVQLSGCSWDSIAVGATQTCTGTYTVQASDLAGGATTIHNSATVTGTPPSGPPFTSDPGTKDVPILTPHLTVVKVATTVTSASGTVTPVPSGSTAAFAKAGDVVTYQITVTNDGEVALSDVTINDSLPGVVLGDGCSSIGTLGVGDHAVCTATYTVTPQDVLDANNGAQLVNTATATGTPPGGGTPYTSPPGTANADLTQLTLTKNAAETVVRAAGDLIHYTFTVVNTGTVAMDQVAIDDAMIGSELPETCTSMGTLASGASATCQATYTVTDADIAKAAQGDPIVNSATVTGTPTGSNTPYTSDPKTATVDVAQLTINKSAAEHAVYAAGDVIHYTFQVANVGTVAMSNVAVVDTSLPAPGVQLSGCTWTTLAAGATQTCTGTYTVQASDLAGGKTTVENSATVTGTPPGSNTPLESPPSTVDVDVRTPHLSVTKTANPTTVARIGQVVTYTITVTNDGMVDMSDVTVQDALPGVTLSAGCASIGTLAVGDHATCTATYTATATDFINGVPIQNTATATGTPDGGTPYTSDPAHANVTPAQDTTLALAVTVNKSTGAVAGDKLVYTYKVTNNGNVPMTNLTIAKVSFSGAGEWPQADLSTCVGDFTPPLTADTVINPGAVVTCQSVPYTVTDQDVAEGDEIVNTAIAQGTPAPIVHAGDLGTKNSPPASAETTPTAAVKPVPVMAKTGGTVAVWNKYGSLPLVGACFGVALIGWLGWRRRRLEDAS